MSVKFTNKRSQCCASLHQLISLTCGIAFDTLCCHVSHRCKKERKKKKEMFFTLFRGHLRSFCMNSDEERKKRTERYKIRRRWWVFIDVRWSQTGRSPWPQRSLRAEGLEPSLLVFPVCQSTPPPLPVILHSYLNFDPWHHTAAGPPASQDDTGPSLQRIQVCAVRVETLVEERFPGFL